MDEKKINKILKDFDKLNDKQLLHKMRHCSHCDKKIIPDLEAIADHTGEWDGHTYKFDCNCNREDLRLSIG